MKRAVLIDEASVASRYPITETVVIIRRYRFASCAQIADFQLREYGDIDVIVKCVIPPSGPVLCLSSQLALVMTVFIVLHICCWHVEQACDACRRTGQKSYLQIAQ